MYLDKETAFQLVVIEAERGKTISIFDIRDMSNRTISETEIERTLTELVNDGKVVVVDSEEGTYTLDPSLMEPRELEIGEVPEEYTGSEIYEQSPRGELVRTAFRKWCADNGVFYYARPREDFSITEAQTLARRFGKSKIYAEDMS